MMENTVGISFSKNYCYLTQFLREKEKLSLVGVTSFSDEQDPLNALRINAGIVQSLISSSAQVVLALPSQAVLLKSMTVDSTLRDEDIICHIQSQSLILFGYTPEHLSFDYETRSIEDGTHHIIVAACHQQKVVTYQHCFTELKIPLHAIDIDVFALLRLSLFLKRELIDLTSPAALAHLNSFLLVNDDDMTTTLHDLKTNLDKLGFSYEALNIASPFKHSHHPLLISMGAALWSES